MSTEAAPLTATYGPLTAEQEASERRMHGYPAHLRIGPCVVCRFLATLDREHTEHAALREALEVISAGRHPDGHRGAVLVARAALGEVKE